MERHIEEERLEEIENTSGRISVTVGDGRGGDTSVNNYNNQKIPCQESWVQIFTSNKVQCVQVELI